MLGVGLAGEAFGVAPLLTGEPEASISTAFRTSLIRSYSLLLHIDSPFRCSCSSRVDALRTSCPQPRQRTIAEIDGIFSDPGHFGGEYRPFDESGPR
jgi:hypothetical protein